MTKFQAYQDCSVSHRRKTTFREQALLLTSDPPSDNVLEGLYVSKFQDSSQIQTIMALYNQKILRRGVKSDYHRFENVCEIIY